MSLSKRKVHGWMVWSGAISLAGCVVTQAPPSEDKPGSATGARTAELAPVVAAVVTTPTLDNFDEAPRTPDADDPAIWHPPSRRHAPLVIGTLKNAGIEVYDLSGNVLQTVSPPNRPAISAEDPKAPGAQPEESTGACPGSESGETFGRFNNVDIVYGFPLRGPGKSRRKVDVAVVSDRGCDTLHFYAIDPVKAGGPLFDITAADAPRVFPERRVEPSAVQSPGAPTRVEPNPLDDQDTAYGLDAYGDDGEFHAAVSQEHRNTVALVDLVATSTGTISYAVRARLHLPSNFEVPSEDGTSTIAWTPCREDPVEDLQVEGIVVDEDHETLYLSQEIVGVWEVDLDDEDELKGDLDVPAGRLVEPVRTFGAPFFAIPNDDDEFDCEEERPDGELPEGSFEGPGNRNVGGANLEADIEGVTIYYAGEDAAYLIVSSQGSSSFQVYDLDDDEDPLDARHVGELVLDGIGSSDGLDVSNANLGGAFRKGLLVLQNGEAPPAGTTDPIHGFEYDGSSQFVYVRWADVAASFDPPLEIDTSRD